MLRRRSPQWATLAPDGSARPDCKGCCVRRGGKYRTLHTEKSTQRGDGALPMPQGRGLRADREGQYRTDGHRSAAPSTCTAIGLMQSREISAVQRGVNLPVGKVSMKMASAGKLSTPSKNCTPLSETPFQPGLGAS